MTAKKNYSLWIGLAIPAVMILLVILSVFIPRFFTQPKTNFLYSSGEFYRYSVENGSLQDITDTYPELPGYYGSGNPQPAKLFIYDVATNQSSEVSFEDAKKLKLDSSTESPDGFTVQYGGGGDSFPFLFYSGRDYNARYITGHGMSRKLAANTANTSYSSFIFLGWIIE